MAKATGNRKKVVVALVIGGILYAMFRKPATPAAPPITPEGPIIPGTGPVITPTSNVNTGSIPDAPAAGPDTQPGYSSDAWKTLVAEYLTDGQLTMQQAVDQASDYWGVDPPQV